MRAKIEFVWQGPKLQFMGVEWPPSAVSRFQLVSAQGAQATIHPNLQFMSRHRRRMAAPGSFAVPANLGPGGQATIYPKLQFIPSYIS